MRVTGLKVSMRKNYKRKYKAKSSERDSRVQTGTHWQGVITTFIKGVCVYFWPNGCLFQLLTWLSHRSQWLYQHCVRNSVLWNQIVSPDSRQCYIPAQVLSDDTKVMKYGFTSNELVCVSRKQARVSVNMSTCFTVCISVFGEPPQWVIMMEKGLPQTAPRKPRPAGTPLTIRWTGGVFRHRPCDDGNFSDLWCHFWCSAPHG